MTALVVVLLVVVVAGLLGYGAQRIGRGFAEANQIIPGVATRAPRSWAGAHSPEARLHRRIRDAMVAVGAGTAPDDVSLHTVRAELERHALATDERLIAVAALPEARRKGAMDELGAAVDAIERAVAAMVELSGPSAGELGTGIVDVETRVALVAQARRELAALDPTSAEVAELRGRLGTSPDVEPTVGPSVGPETEPPEATTDPGDGEGGQSTP